MNIRYHDFFVRIVPEQSMKMLNGYEITLLLFQVGIILGFARLLGEIARRYRQTMVIDEIMAGIILGPTVLGSFFPEFEDMLFPVEHNTRIAGVPGKVR
jgi:hypothetical protein